MNACKRKKLRRSSFFCKKIVLASFCGVFGLRQATPKCQLQSVHYKLKLKLSGLFRVLLEQKKTWVNLWVGVLVGGVVSRINKLSW